MEVRRMHKATNNFVVKMDGGIVREVGKSVICQPRTSYNGRKTKWYEDKRKKEKKKVVRRQKQERKINSSFNKKNQKNHKKYKNRRKAP